MACLFLLCRCRYGLVSLLFGAGVFGQFWLAMWFEAQSLGPAQSAQVLAVGVAMLLLMEAGKAVQRRLAVPG